MQSCVHSFFFFFAGPTDPPLQEGGRWETKHFMGMALAMIGSTSSTPTGIIFSLVFKWLTPESKLVIPLDWCPLKRENKSFIVLAL